MTKIINLYQTCPNCQTALIKTDTSAHCPNCQFLFYLNPAPCVTILIVNKQNQILWTIRGIQPQKGYYDFPGGFVELGESLEQAVIREAKEELSVDVAIIAALGNIPDVYDQLEQPTLNFVYLVEIVAGELKPQDDVAELKWIDLDNPPSPIAFKNATIALETYKKSKGGS